MIYLHNLVCEYCYGSSCYTVKAETMGFLPSTQILTPHTISTYKISLFHMIITQTVNFTQPIPFHPTNICPLPSRDAAPFTARLPPPHRQRCRHLPRSSRRPALHRPVAQLHQAHATELLQRFTTAAPTEGIRKNHSSTGEF
jgi:hypothetical protein